MVQWRGSGLLSLRSLSASAQDEGAGKLTHPSSVDNDKKERGRIVCVTSGKGGVGKTTASASFAYGLASQGHSTCVVDFDIGLRNLDIHLGMERRVIFDMVHVLLEECSLHQALLKDKREPNLSLLAASQTRDKDVLTVDGVERILAGLTESFDYVGTCLTFTIFLRGNRPCQYFLFSKRFSSCFCYFQFWIHLPGSKVEHVTQCISAMMLSLSLIRN